MTSPTPTNRSTLYPDQEPRAIVPDRTPTIQTERLILRPIQLSDAPDLFEFRSRQDVADFLWPKTPHKSIQETEDVIIKKTFQTPDASGESGRLFTFAVIQRDDPTQKAIGTVGVNALVPAPSIGYGMHPDFWGKGYMSEAAAGVIDAWWKLERIEDRSSEHVEPERLYAGCNKDNMGSLKVLLKNGFRIYEEIPLEGDIVALLCMDRP